ncbi:hypothetical protein HHK36_013704 [Tetracentron sinense]|uniref:Diacylglycerol kinase n=1 Tax=Tetracentron sinense TaxID=13715 RepID=A0A834Z7L4_TETSI|nr:hypothetical protein HHK36_013704 [Tetracentron sinense]
MDSPSSTGGDSTRITTRSSIVESFRGCGLSGIRIDKEDLRRRILIPEYLRLAMRDAIESKDPNAGERRVGSGNDEAPVAPMVVFVNSRSGGRYGPILKGRLQELMGEEQVFDLSSVKPPEFVQYGLACLEKLAGLGDQCAKETREKLRVVVAGGDGTVGWVLGSLAELYKQNREPVPPTGIIPLGTGNDLSRSFGWGGSFPFAWRSAVKRSLHKSVTGRVCRLDSWHVLVSMPAGEHVELPLSMKHTEEGMLDQVVNIAVSGMDAQVAYGFHHLRDEKPYLAHGPIANKLIYSGYSCTQGWFFTPCMSDPSLSVRAIVALNLHNYGSGRNPWGNLKPDYLEKKGFVEAHADDGLLEIFGLKHGWHASFVMVELISAKHIAQASAIRLEIRGGEWKQAYMQADGEPWKQTMNKEYSTFVEIKRVPFQSLVINGE